MAPCSINFLIVGAPNSGKASLANAMYASATNGHERPIRPSSTSSLYRSFNVSQTCVFPYDIGVPSTPLQVRLTAVRSAEAGATSCALRGSGSESGGGCSTTVVASTTKLLLACQKPSSIHGVAVLADATSFGSMTEALAWKKELSTLFGDDSQQQSSRTPPITLVVTKIDACLRGSKVPSIYPPGEPGESGGKTDDEETTALKTFCQSHGFTGGFARLSLVKDFEAVEELLKMMIGQSLRHKERRKKTHAPPSHLAGAYVGPQGVPETNTRRHQLPDEDLELQVRSTPSMGRISVVVSTPKDPCAVEALTGRAQLFFRSESSTSSVSAPLSPGYGVGRGGHELSAPIANRDYYWTKRNGSPCLLLTFVVASAEGGVSDVSGHHVTQRTRQLTISFQQHSGRQCHWSGTATTASDGSIVTWLREALFLSFAASTAENIAFASQVRQCLLDLEMTVQPLLMSIGSSGGLLGGRDRDSGNEGGNWNLQQVQPLALDRPVLIRFAGNNYVTWYRSSLNLKRTSKPSPSCSNGNDERDCDAGSFFVFRAVEGDSPTITIETYSGASPAPPQGPTVLFVTSEGKLSTQQREAGFFTCFQTVPYRSDGGVAAIQGGYLSFHLASNKEQVLRPSFPSGVAMGSMNSEAKATVLVTEEGEGERKMSVVLGRPPQNHPLVRCARYLCHSYVARKGFTLADNDTLLDEILQNGNPRGWIEQMVEEQQQTTTCGDGGSGFPSPSSAAVNLLSKSSSPNHPPQKDVNAVLGAAVEQNDQTPRVSAVASLCPRPESLTANCPGAEFIEPETMSNTLVGLNELQPMLCLHQVFGRWDQLLTDSAVTTIPPVTRFFYAALPAITFVALAVCSTQVSTLSNIGAGEGEAINTDGGVGQFFVWLWKKMKQLIGLGSSAYDPIDRAYHERVVHITSLLKDPLFDALTDQLVIGRKHQQLVIGRKHQEMNGNEGAPPTLLVSLDVLHQQLLEHDRSALPGHKQRPSESFESFVACLNSQGKEADECNKIGYFHLYRAMVKVAALQETVHRAKVVAIYGLQDSGKSTLLRTFGFVPRSIGGTTHTREPIAYEYYTPSNGNVKEPAEVGRQRNKDVYLVVDLPGVNDEHQERGRLQAMIIPMLSALFVLQPMINGASAESLEALDTLEKQLPMNTFVESDGSAVAAGKDSERCTPINATPTATIPILVLFVKPNQRFKEIVEDSLVTQNSQPLPATITYHEQCPPTLWRAFDDKANSSEAAVVLEYHPSASGGNVAAPSMWIYVPQFQREFKTTKTAGPAACASEKLWTEYFQHQEPNRIAVQCRRAIDLSTGKEALSVSLRNSGPFGNATELFFQPVVAGESVAVAGEKAQHVDPSVLAGKVKHILISLEDKGMQNAHRSAVIGRLKEQLREMICMFPQPTESTSKLSAEEVTTFLTAGAAVVRQAINKEDGEAPGQAQWFAEYLLHPGCYGPRRIKIEGYGTTETDDRKTAAGHAVTGGRQRLTVEFLAEGWTRKGNFQPYAMANDIPAYRLAAKAEALTEEVQMQALRVLRQEAQLARSMIVSGRPGSALSKIPHAHFQMFAPRQEHSRYLFYREFVGLSSTDTGSAAAVLGAEELDWLEGNVVFRTHEDVPDALRERSSVPTSSPNMTPKEAPPLAVGGKYCGSYLWFESSATASKAVKEWRQVLAVLSRGSCERVLDDLDMKFLLDTSLGWRGKLDDSLLARLTDRVC